MIGTFFIPPLGRQEQHEVTEVEPQDASFFEQQGVKVSFEQLMNGQNVIYADTGKRTEDGEPDELIVVSKGRSCQECLAELRKLCEARFAADKPVHYHDIMGGR